MAWSAQLEQLGAIALMEEVAGILDVDSDFPDLVDETMAEVLATAEDGFLDGRYVALTALKQQLEEMFTGRKVRVEFRCGHPKEAQPVQGTWMRCGTSAFELRDDDGRIHLIGHTVCGWLELLDNNE